MPQRMLEVVLRLRVVEVFAVVGAHMLEHLAAQSFADVLQTMPYVVCMLCCKGPNKERSGQQGAVGKRPQPSAAARCALPQLRGEPSRNSILRRAFSTHPTPPKLPQPKGAFSSRHITDGSHDALTLNAVGQ